jgi:hypothetical protein
MQALLVVCGLEYDLRSFFLTTFFVSVYFNTPKTNRLNNNLAKCKSNRLYPKYMGELSTTSGSHREDNRLGLSSIVRMLDRFFCFRAVHHTLRHR